MTQIPAQRLPEQRLPEMRRLPEIPQQRTHPDPAPGGPPAPALYPAPDPSVYPAPDPAVPTPDMAPDARSAPAQDTVRPAQEAAKRANDTVPPVKDTVVPAKIAAAPVKRARLVGVDATRGVALLGMMAVHSLYDSTASGKPSWSFAIFGGRAAATFAVLSGVGIAFMTGRRRVPFRAAPATVATLVVRALAICAIGMALGHTDASIAAVILPYYAVMFLLMIPLVFLPTWLVATIGTLVAVGAPVLTHRVLPRLPVPNLDNPGFGSLAHPLSLLSELTITGEYPALPWMVYLCAGLVVGRLTLTRLRTAVALLGTGLVLAVGTAVASSMLLHRYGGLAHIWAAQPRSVLTVPETTEMLTLGGDGTTPASTWWWLAVNAPHTSTPFDLVGTTGAGLALLGFMLLAGRVAARIPRGVITVVLAPLAAAGSMTLSFYVAHILFINSEYDPYTPGTSYLLQVIVVLLAGLAWRATAGRGPLEGLVSALANRARRWATPASRRPPVRPVAAAAAMSLGNRLGLGGTLDGGPMVTGPGGAAEGPAEVTVRLPVQRGRRRRQRATRRHSVPDYPTHERTRSRP
ncbi:DUF1624 domain-containing protein [Planosporangium thailandense]|uniref:DUF1624 domain-containing protein n=1 Tax=Planosporangium thailandense TaxID=765197 RepID=A0ABX0Y5F3_9ACTN|nr:heparan-alpha-glucosaminide N-acetyltransferase domain-containing protein [Planosporangium thailandense]NJC72529.1 DUF1624 domain-containing protein [Planosporangium thailandense]